MHGTDEEERPRPPEPEIIYTPEEEDGGGRTRLIAGAFVGLALLGGVIIALSLNDGGSGVAPVSPDVTSIPDEAPAQQQAAATPAAPETVETAETNPEATVPGESAPAETPELRASAEPAQAEPEAAPAAPETATSEGAPTSITPPAAATKSAEVQSKAEEPTAAAPAPAKSEPAAKATATASGGAYVVQIMALREEGAAKTAWASLQKKHASVLGGHALDIEKADLGDKGTFYRVRAAGFETKAAAQSACSSLKAAGQDCLVKSR